MSRTPLPESATIGQIVGEFRSLGVSAPLPWTTPEVARAQAGELVAQLGPHHQEIVKNPHRDAEWARAAVCSAALLGAVHAVIGPDVAVENTFLVVKWPGSDFEIPWHQDGIGRRIELDPDRSVSAWLAVTDATVSTGCLEVMHGSQRLGYLPYGLEEPHGAERGRAGCALGFSGDGTPVPVSSSQAVLMDVRLLHRSGSNTGRSARIGLNVRYVAPGAARMLDHTNPDLDPISGTGW